MNTLGAPIQSQTKMILVDQHHDKKSDKHMADTTMQLKEEPAPRSEEIDTILAKEKMLT